MSDPLFQVNDLNPLLYRRIKQLDKTRVLRTKLFFLKDFLFTCRFATRYVNFELDNLLVISCRRADTFLQCCSLQDVLKKEPSYIMSDPHVYSIQNFIDVKLSVLSVKLQELVQVCCAHVVDCEVSYFPLSEIIQ